MGLKKGKGKSSPVNGERIRGRSTEDTDQWAFLGLNLVKELVLPFLPLKWSIHFSSDGYLNLSNFDVLDSPCETKNWEEIEAPMWVDLTLEAQLMGQDIGDDAWFRTSHPVHQLSSRHLKSSFPRCVHEQEDSPKLLCHSPKLPDSVSRSRGKHYKSRKWEGNNNGVLVDKPHPVGKLGGKGLRSVTRKSASGSSSTSTLTTNTSIRKSSSNFKDMKHNYGFKSNSRSEPSSSSSIVSSYQILKPKPRSGGPEYIFDAAPATSEVSCGTSEMASRSNPRGSRNPRCCSRRETVVERVLQNRKSSSSKSSVGSSYSLRCKLRDISFTATQKEQTITETKTATRSVSILRMPERQIPDRNSSSKNQRRADCNKLVFQESKSKNLASTAPTKPLCLLDKSKPEKNGVMTQKRMISSAAKFNSVAASERENAKEGKIQNLKAVKQGRHASRYGLKNHKIYIFISNAAAFLVLIIFALLFREKIMVQGKRAI
ncbi:hypothetical protein COCNU_04G007820 [Cocos nucifera]|uniref:Uncharacterized protein n=1 Tax=Cocos nucifera TaxID=13894 RepID=A0A8K0I5Z0_COCNU|nr:hypothetical protein COCNU_04G007820 [Cocos nucifera]